MDHFDTTRELYRSVVKPIATYTRRRRLDIVLDYVVGKDVLDLGCVEHEASVSDKCDWWLHGLIRDRAKSVKGVDYDAEEVAKLRERGYDVCVADAENMNLGDRYEVVVAGELFEHLTNHRSFLESVGRHLVPEGLLVMSVPNANSLNYLLQNLVYGHEVDAWDHAVFFTPVTMSVMLMKCGFVPVRIVLYQPSEVFHHTSPAHRVLAYVSNRIQQLACLLWPSLARGMVVVARPSDAETAHRLP
ncbi:MAG: methyltransferase domain-containing protein [Actinomycetota bacterium]|nr:methyltransferase domain-containing protein [Actinomycetota bacterium]